MARTTRTQTQTTPRTYADMTLTELQAARQGLLDGLSKGLVPALAVAVTGQLEVINTWITMKTTTITVDIRPYVRCHHRVPSQPRYYTMTPWAFQIDANLQPVFITASYADAVLQAKTMAQYSITVLP